MQIDAESLKRLVLDELSHVYDVRVTSHILSMLIEPYSIMRDWDYGSPGQQYLCWMTLKDSATFTEIGYCEEGFGPQCPWGLIGSGENQSMGMDSGWYRTLMDAYFDSSAATMLPIWRVIRRESEGVETPLSAEGDWDTTWREIMRLRVDDPAQARRYACGHTIILR